MCSRSEPGFISLFARIHIKIRTPIRACRGESYWCANSDFDRDVTFELHPVEPLNIFLRVGVYEVVQFAISDVVEHPAVCGVVKRLRQPRLEVSVVSST
jgi:hypothetical protein